MQKTVPRAYSDHWKWKHTYPSRATSPTKARSTVWRPWRIRLSTWSFYRTTTHSILVITMATKQRLVVNVELGFVEIFILEWAVIFLQSFQMSDFFFWKNKLARNSISWQPRRRRRGRVNSTPTRHTFSSCAFCQRACPSFLSQLSRYTQPHRHALTPRTARLKITEHIVGVLPQKQSHFIAHCHMLHLTWLHRARALFPYLRHHLPHMSYIHLSASTNPAEIYGHIWVPLWLSSDPSQLVSPSSFVKTRITVISPKTRTLLNTRIATPLPDADPVNVAKTLLDGNRDHLLGEARSELRNSSLHDSKCYSAGKCRATCRVRWRTNWKHNSNADDCKKAVNHEIFLTGGNSTEFYGCTGKTADIGASVR